MRTSFFVAAVLLFAVPSASRACSFPLRHHTSEEIKKMAEDAFASASIIIDGEVISPMAVGQVPDGTVPLAYIKVLHTWKGTVPDDFAPVAYLSLCDVTLAAKGQKLRILLSGSGIFTADQETNGASVMYEKDAFNREIDRLVGAARPADFTDPGTALPPG
jgi:hypothetical protein